MTNASLPLYFEMYTTAFTCIKTELRKLLQLSVADR